MGVLDAPWDRPQFRYQMLEVLGELRKSEGWAEVNSPSLPVELKLEIKGIRIALTTFSKWPPNQGVCSGKTTTNRHAALRWQFLAPAPAAFLPSFW